MIKLIACIDENNGLGYNNKLLTKLPNDMQHFKQLTTGNTIVMGRKTFESIGHALPNRTNIVLTRNENFKAENILRFSSVNEVLRHYYSYFVQSDLYICGGEEIYKQFLGHADEVLLTVVCNKFDQVDTYFPKLDDTWKFKESIENHSDSDNEFAHWFVTYEKCRNNNK